MKFNYLLLVLLVPIYLAVSQLPSFAQPLIPDQSAPLHHEYLLPTDNANSSFFETNVPAIDAILSFLGFTAIILLLVNAVWSVVTLVATGATEVILTSLIPSILLLIPAFPYLFNGNLDKALKAPLLSTLFTIITFFSVSLGLRYLSVENADNIGIFSAALVYLFYFIASFIDAPRSKKRAFLNDIEHLKLVTRAN